MGGLRGLGLVEEGFGVSEVGLGVYRFGRFVILQCISLWL